MLTARTLLLICLTTACWAFGFGVASQLVSHWLSALGAGDTVIGFSHAFYYLGLATGSAAVPWMTRRLGPVACASIGMVGAGVTVAIFPWTDGEWGWYLLRLVNGWAGAMSLVPLEIIVSRDSPPPRKTQNFACYSVSIVVGFALGIAVGLNLYRPNDLGPFCLGGAVGVIGGLALLFMLTRRATMDVGPAPVALGLLRNFPSYGTAWYQGFLEGGMLAFLTLYLTQARHFSEADAGTLFGAAIAGVIVFQLPISWLADRYGKTPMLLGCYSVVVFWLIAIPLLADPILLGVGLFCFGACSGAMYPLGLSRLSDRMPEAGLARAYAWFLAIECLGSVGGAAVMGAARDYWGRSDAIFGVGLAGVVLVLAIWAGLRYFFPADLGGDDPRAEKKNELLQTACSGCADL